MQQGIDRVQQLKMERNYMLERQQQLQQQVNFKLLNIITLNF